MEPNGLPGGMFSNMSSGGGGGGSGGGSGLIGLEMSLNHHNHPSQPPTTTQLHHRHHQFPVVANFHDPQPQTSSANKQGGYNININTANTHHPFAAKPRNNVSNVSAVNSAASDEDELNPATEDSGDGKRKGTSPWQRMKWTDNMVKLLIMVVFYVGDEVGSEGPDPASKKKTAGTSGGGVLQKKGKWKSVSRAMMERGFFVSPQQCEDKFNDLNKRYKRVNDILGKGTACKVVENQSLLETMDHLSPKMKEEVKKLLNSKHLFFREMCAYHKSCGGGAGAQSVHQSSLPEAAADHNQNQLPSHNQQVQTTKCLHTNEKNGRAETEVSKIVKGGSGEDDDDYEDDDDEDEDDEYGDDEAECVAERSHNNNHNNGHGDHGHNGDPRFSRKKAKVEMAMVQQLSGEVMGVFQDVTKSLLEKRQWMKTRLMQLEEQRVGYQGQAFELEKQRLKWVKFSCKKERDMEDEKLRNERLRLENDRMILLLRQKELELIDLQQQHFSSNKRASDPSSITG